MPPSPLRRALAVVASAVAGAVAIDLYLVIVEAWLLRIATPVTVSQWDASNLLGRSAFSGGIATAALGFGMHLCVCLCWALLFVALFGQSALLARRPLLLGTLFGVFVMFFMRYAVVPLGHAAQAPLTWDRALVLVVAHTLAFGVPVAYVARRVLRLQVA